jgi:hypothetical protein
MQSPRNRPNIACFLPVALLTLMIGIGILYGNRRTSIGLAPSSPSEPPAPAAPVVTPRPKPGDLKLLDNRLESERSSRYIVGTVQNNSGRLYIYAQVQAILLDKHGKQVGSSLANTNNLEAGKKWTFKAVIQEAKATHYKIIDVSGW